MSRHFLKDDAVPPIPLKPSTALLLINNQLGFRDAASWGNGTSNPEFERNIASLIKAFRDVFDADVTGERPLIIHVQYRPVWTDHPLHVSRIGPFGQGGEHKRAIDFLEFAAPRLPRPEGLTLVHTFDESPFPSLAISNDSESNRDAAPKPPSDEIVMTSHGHSVFINTPLQSLLNRRGIKNLIIAGMATDLAVSTAVRSAQNLALTGKWGGKGNMVDARGADRWTNGIGVYVDADPNAAEDEQGEDGLAVDMPRIILVGDATRTFGKGGLDAQTVHDVHIESLKYFAEVRATAEVLQAFG